MTPDAMPEIEFVVRRFVENDCQVTMVVIDPADAQQTLYGTVTHHGRLIGSYYCTDTVRQRGWRIVTAKGEYLSADGVELRPTWEGDAVWVLTRILTGHDQDEIDRRLRAGPAHLDGEPVTTAADVYERPRTTRGSLEGDAASTYSAVGPTRTSATANHRPVAQHQVRDRPDRQAAVIGGTTPKTRPSPGDFHGPASPDHHDTAAGSRRPNLTHRGVVAPGWRRGDALPVPGTAGPPG